MDAQINVVQSLETGCWKPLKSPFITEHLPQKVTIAHGWSEQQTFEAKTGTDSYTALENRHETQSSFSHLPAFPLPSSLLVDWNKVSQHINEGLIQQACKMRVAQMQSWECYSKCVWANEFKHFKCYPCLGWYCPGCYMLVLSRRNNPRWAIYIHKCVAVPFYTASGVAKRSMWWADEHCTILSDEGQQHLLKSQLLYWVSEYHCALLQIRRNFNWPCKSRSKK